MFCKNEQTCYKLFFCNNLTYKSNYQQVSNLYLMEINNALIWLEITCKWILDQKLIGFYYRLCSNNEINSCGLNSNNQTTAEDSNTRRRRYCNIHTSWYVEAYSTGYQIDVLCRQQIKLFQVVSTSEFHEYWWNDLENIFLVPAAFWGASEVRTQSRP